MPIRVAINGFGRIGRLVYRAGMKNSHLEFVAVNDLSDAQTLAHLLKYDSIHRKLESEVKVQDDKITVDGKVLQVLKQKELAGLPWGQMGIDIVVESSGRFTDKETASVHLKDGAKKVLISAPTKGADATIVLGVNDSMYDMKKHNVISIGSCTTNCLGPVAKILNDNFGIQKGFMTTIHAYTNDQNTLDQVHRDLRRARAAAVSMIPTTTGAAKAISLVLPELEGKMDGVAIRVPVANGSLIDLACIVNKDATVADVNNAFKEAANGKMKRYLEYTEDPIVSVDIVGNPHSAVFDALSTMVMGKNLVKVFAWYDNEWGFSCRVVEMLERMMGD
ncbi:MAG: type I glyceraldehyde-3-phosphate dehydrogenase [candidate division Zixibacteria bacterium RBG_16_40_9]|nr:MAG: type I glyceraldehyde-3-phosphate dehydrogenase [candidate division Zixibacteria bacterium RBG_16_40_9]